MNEQEIYHLPVWDTITTAWDKVKGAKATIWAAIIIVFLLQMLFSVIDKGVEHHSAWVGHIVTMITNIITYLLQMGIVYIGILRAKELPISYKMVLRAFTSEIALKLIGFYILEMLILLIPVLLVFAPTLLALANGHETNPYGGFAIICGIAGVIIGIYLAMRLALGMGLVVEKGAGPIDAIKSSFKGTRDNVLRLFAWTILITLIVGISAIPLGIGLIWTLPLATINYGVMYKRMLVNIK